MGRRWIVDASNVFGSRPDGWWRDRPRALARLVAEIVRWREVTGEPVMVVADGHPTAHAPEGELYGVEVRYARSNAPDAADDEIVRLVQTDSVPEGVVVVTSDRRLRDRVIGLGAEVDGPRRFLARVADIEPRRSDRAVLAEFGIDESALLGGGGEARVFALDRERVLRLPHPSTDPASLEARRGLLAAIASPGAPVAIPEVLEHRQVAGRLVVIERRLPGRNALDALGEVGTDRTTLIRHHLDVARAIAARPCPTDQFGEIWGAGAIRSTSFAAWATARVTTSLRAASGSFAPVDPGHLATELVAALATALPEPEPARPRLVHLDAFLGNMLAEGNRISAVLDFGPMTIGGPPDLDAVVAVAYLAPEITPTATAEDRKTALAWAEDAGLEPAVAPAERWIAAYWSAATDDERLVRWCRRILLPPDR